MLDLVYGRVNNEVRELVKRDEDAGYDLFVNPVWFRENYPEGFAVIQPQELLIIPAGIVTAFSKDYVGLLFERGSTGVRCMSKRAGVIDSGFRNEWMIPINNTGDKVIILYDPALHEALEDLDDFTYYSIKKGIGQVIFMQLPDTNISELPVSMVETIASERGTKMLGSTNHIHEYNEA